jgi:hypothetical protein
MGSHSIITSGVRLPSMNGNASATAAMASVTSQGPRATVMVCRRVRRTNGSSAADAVKTQRFALLHDAITDGPARTHRRAAGFTPPPCRTVQPRPKLRRWAALRRPGCVAGALRFSRITANSSAGTSPRPFFGVLERVVAEALLHVALDIALLEAPVVALRQPHDLCLRWRLRCWRGARSQGTGAAGRGSGAAGAGAAVSVSGRACAGSVGTWVGSPRGHHGNRGPSAAPGFTATTRRGSPAGTVPGARYRSQSATFPPLAAGVV